MPKPRLVVLEKPRKTKKNAPRARTTLDELLIRDICRLVRKGLPFQAACDYLAISGATLSDWRRRGERYLNGNKPKSDAIYGELTLAMRKAFASYQLKLVKSLHRPGNPFWSQPLAILSRRDRANWGWQAPPGGTETELDQDERFL